MTIPRIQDTPPPAYSFFGETEDHLHGVFVFGCQKVCSIKLEASLFHPRKVSVKPVNRLGHPEYVRTDERVLPKRVNCR